MIPRAGVRQGAITKTGSRHARRLLVEASWHYRNARLLVLDVTDATSVAAAAEQVEHLDVLVNNAGVMIDGKTATEADVDSFRRTYETNVFGVLAVTNAFLPALRRSAHPRIVNVSSGTGSLGWSSGPNPQFPDETGGTGAGYRSSKSNV